MQIVPYLSFDGRCAEAFRFYERVLGGKIEFMQSYGDSPMRDQAPPCWQDRVMHATLSVASHTLMGADNPPEHYRKPQGTSLAINLADAAEAERIFAALAEGGEVAMPLQKTFWAGRFGMLTDRFGTPWLVNCEQGD
jgi:PhnB protein